MRPRTALRTTRGRDTRACAFEPPGWRRNYSQSKGAGARLKSGPIGRVVHKDVEYTAKKFQKFLVGKCNHGVECDGAGGGQGSSGRFSSARREDLSHHRDV